MLYFCPVSHVVLYCTAQPIRFQNIGWLNFLRTSCRLMTHCSVKEYVLFDSSISRITMPCASCIYFQHWCITYWAHCQIHQWQPKAICKLYAESNTSVRKTKTADCCTLRHRYWHWIKIRLWWLRAMETGNFYFHRIYSFMWSNWSEIRCINSFVLNEFL